MEPLIRTLDVPCSQKNAFEVFLDKMDTWWPMDRFTVSAMQGAPARAIRVEARVGGEIVEIGADGTEVVWGVIKEIERHSRLIMEFHVPRPGDVITGRPLLDLSFQALGPTQTRVTLTQSNFEALGEMGAPSRQGYNFVWTPIFAEGFGKACGL